MEAEIAATAALVLLFLTLGAEADICVFPSLTFEGWCANNQNCAAVCVNEGYDGGFCQGQIHRKCMCTILCGGIGGDGGGGGDGSKGDGKASSSQPGLPRGGCRVHQEKVASRVHQKKEGAVSWVG
ncbi:hypothetical protein ACP70R_029689 [Stipagrostis hirtigluma subsp. patula]